MKSNPSQRSSEQGLFNKSFLPARNKNLNQLKVRDANMTQIKRVPFSEILNQEEEDLSHHNTNKIFNEQQKRQISKHSSSQGRKSSEQISNKNQKGKLIEKKGTRSVQLIQILEVGPDFSDDSRVKRTQDFQTKFNQKSKFPKKASQLEKKFKLVLNQEAVQDLFNLSGNLQTGETNFGSEEQFVFCAVVGKTKTGKSFLLSELIKSFQNSTQQEEKSTFQENAFTVNHTLAPCTKGIWVSKEKISLQSNDETINLILLDTQGLGSYQSTQQLDYKLLTLSLLFSDVFCYNSIGPVDEQMLSGMSLAVEIGKQIQKSQQKTNPSPLSIKSPSLLWILRDFSLELQDKSRRKITSDEYLENCLSLEVKNDARKNKQNIRRAIKEIFKNRKCSTMVTPFDDDGSIRSQFQNDLEKLQHKFRELIQGSKRKKFNNGTNQLKEFIERLRTLVHVLNSENQQTGSACFPKIQLLQNNLTKAKLLFQLKKFGQKYDQLFQKYQLNLDHLSLEAQCTQNYLQKIQHLKQTLDKEIAQVNLFFKQHLKATFRHKNFNDQNQTCEERVHKDKKHDESQNSELSFNELLQQGINHNLVETLKENYRFHWESVKQKKELINEKIQAIIESHTCRQIQCKQLSNLIEAKITDLHEKSGKWISMLKSASQISELKKVYDKSMSEMRKTENEIKKISQQIQLKNSLKRSDGEQQMKIIQREVEMCLKYLEVEYLKQKVNLMELSQIQNSCGSFFNSSAQKDTDKIKPYGECFNCEKSFYIPYIIIPTHQLLKINFIKTVVKELPQMFDQFLIDQAESHQNKISKGTDRKCKLEFIIEVKLNDKNWLIRRKFKDFIELHKIVNIMFPSLSSEELHQHKKNAPNSINGNSQEKQKLNKRLGSFELSLSCEQFSSQDKVKNRKNEVERFLNNLNGIYEIRNSRILQKFVKINKEYLDL